MLQNNNPKNDLEEKMMLQTLANVCQGLISILPLTDAPYDIIMANDDNLLSVRIAGNTGIKFDTSLAVSKENGEEFLNAFRNYFIENRDIYVSTFSRMNTNQYIDYKYRQKHSDVKEEAARTHTIQNHMYKFIVNRYYGLEESDNAAHERALTKMCEANQKVMK